MKNKQLLILVDKIGEKKEFFAHYISQRLPEGSFVTISRFSDLTFDVQSKNIKVGLGDGGDIKDYDFVYFRRTGSKFLSLAGTLAVCLDYFGIAYADTTYANLGPSGDKFTSLVRLAIDGILVIPSYLCWHTEIEAKADEIISKFGLPLVTKQLSSQRGRGVFLLKSKEEFGKLDSQFPDEEFLFQKYLPSNEEYRILVLEDKVGSFEKKVRTDPDEFRSNVALGAREEFIDISKISPEIKNIAVEASKALNIQIAGVDVLIDEGGKPWLLEVNRGPGLTYDPKVSPELDSLSLYFTHKLKGE